MHRGVHGVRPGLHHGSRALVARKPGVIVQSKALRGAGTRVTVATAILSVPRGDVENASSPRTSAAGGHRRGSGGVRQGRSGEAVCPPVARQRVRATTHHAHDDQFSGRLGRAAHCSHPGQSGLARPSQAEASALLLSAEPEDTGILRWTTAIRPSRPSIRAANNRGSAGSPARWSAWSGSKPREPPPGMLC
jgi:hypothetical protein